MPRGAIWSVAWLFIAGLILTPILYFSAMMDDPVVESSMSPDSDSWAIPMLGGAFFGVLLTPIILGVTWACTRRYTKPSLLAWRGERPMRSVIGTVLVLALLGLVLWTWIGDALRSPAAV